MISALSIKLFEFWLNEKQKKNMRFFTFIKQEICLLIKRVKSRPSLRKKLTRNENAIK